MVEYICEKGHVFLHPGKHIYTPRENYVNEKGMEFSINPQTVEVSICPHCKSITYSENRHEQRITSVISVELDAVDAKLKEGYVVEALYAKTATLVKREG